MNSKFIVYMMFIMCRYEQVHGYLEQYVQHYGDAALIFATHDGYPQIVNALLYNKDLGE